MMPLILLILGMIGGFGYEALGYEVRCEALGSAAVWVLVIYCLGSGVFLGLMASKVK